MDIEGRLEKAGLAVPEILLPLEGTDLAKWAVIACDQFTQDRGYWDGRDRSVGAAPSLLRAIFPEVYLEDPDREGRVAGIRDTMEAWLRGGIFAPPRRGFVYVERSTPHNPRRRGLVAAVDLDRYDWRPGSRSLIRATEGTVPERLPPRMEVRRGAALESPHILLLIDDEEDAILPALGRIAKAAPPLYDTDLEPASGHITGWMLDGGPGWEVLASGLEGLCARAGTRYPGDPAPEAERTAERTAEPFLFAMGDGNHSLATAKAVWEEYKAAHPGEPGLERHPARWALAELENLYDPGIRFEPIHRVITGFPRGAGMGEITALLERLPGFARRPLPGREGLAALVNERDAGANRLGLVAGKDYCLVETSQRGLATGYLQPLLDAFLRERPSLGIDYIHGEDELFRLGERDPAEGSVGLLLPPIRKDGLFETVARGGPLPRKSFSMGEACEKRFYLECRRLFG